MFLFYANFIFAVDFYATNNLQIRNIFVLDNHINLLGNLTFVNISTYGYYDLLTSTYTNKSGFSTATLPPFVDKIESLNIFESSNKEILCYHEATFRYCYRFSQATNKWILLTVGTAVTAETGGGQIYLDSTQYGIHNAMNIAGIFYFYNLTTANFVLLSNTGESARIFKQTNPTSSSTIYAHGPNKAYFIYANSTTKRSTFTSTVKTNSALATDGWTDNIKYYAIISSGLYTSTDGKTYTGMTTASCSDIMSLAGLSLYSIDCKNSMECMIGGEYGTDIPLLFAFDGLECEIDADFNYEIQSYNTSISRTIYEVDYVSVDDKYYFGGQNIFGSTTLNIFTTTTIDDATFDSNQCFLIANDVDKLCSNSLYIGVTNTSYLFQNSFLCDIDSLIDCDKACVRILYNLNTSKVVYYSATQTCAQLRNNYPNGIYLENCTNYLRSINSTLCDYNIPLTSCVDTIDFEFYSDAFRSILLDQSLSDYLASRTYIPNTGMEFLNETINNSLYLGGYCTNTGNFTVNKNLCFIINQSVCADNSHVQTCQYDSTGYLSWNITQVCVENLNMNCVGGRCQYVAPQCFKDGDCTSTQKCDLSNNKCIAIGDDTSDLFGGISLTFRYIILIIAIFIALIVPMILGGKEGVLAGLAFSSVITIALSVVFKLTPVLSIVYVILAGGVFAIMMRSGATK